MVGKAVWWSVGFNFQVFTSPKGWIDALEIHTITTVFSINVNPIEVVFPSFFLFVFCK
ncbi:hypothetical protein Scep_014216 [Stephania cephalantha]|uniref:Uncharacterized protein n=1 Tax=Stephania cephalantha TaxID=152367 RepID=A0AAP0J255_9MAGN